ncbi:hypothetical protein [Azospirillum sp. B4]|uniref:hypothetical protein n=1 Tax=Azospirillum sp. B4 TaxID=95605 RepID=UPI00034BEB20|nr:hypothetical protein [Azospirillum sp. B4]
MANQRDEAADPKRLKAEWHMTGNAATKSRGMEDAKGPAPTTGGSRPPKGSAKGDWNAPGEGQKGAQGDRSESTAGTGATPNRSRGRGATS